MKTTLFNRPSMGFILSVIFTLIGSALSYLAVQKFSNSEKWVTHTDIVRGKLESIISGMKDAETGQRGFLLTGNEKFLEPYNHSEAIVRSSFDTVRLLTQDNYAQQAEFNGLKKTIDDKYDLLKATIDQKRQGGKIGLDALLMGKLYMDQSRTIITRMQNREEVLLVSRLSTLHLYGAISLTTIIVTFLISLGSTVYFYNRTLRDYKDRVKLENVLHEENLAIERKVAALKAHAERIGNGDYGIEISPETFR
ncbi:MAG: hypothetical protein EOO20_17295 [Chryseobacterium sp.]|nr:MAG: hypothetical protein EOO20_17295 [Chryseobacterium sp.]